MFHLPSDSALINRYGFPSFGHAAVLSRLSARAAGGSPTPPGALLAVNLGKNKDSPVESLDDFVTGARLFAPHADVLVVNVSSPNTPGLRYLPPSLFPSPHHLMAKMFAGDCKPEGCSTVSLLK